MKRIKKFLFMAIIAFFLGVLLKTITVNIGHDKFMFCRTLESSIEIAADTEKTE